MSTIMDIKQQIVVAEEAGDWQQVHALLHTLPVDNSIGQHELDNLLAYDQQAQILAQRAYVAHMVQYVGHNNEIVAEDRFDAQRVLSKKHQFYG
jgi:hypothetical protein